MPQFEGFIAYAAKPPLIGETIEAAVRKLDRMNPPVAFHTWHAADIAGQFVGTRIIQDIASRRVFVADITVLNFNVTYEIGFAIGQNRRLLLVKHKAFREDPQVKSLGIFDTLGYKPYENSSELASLLISTTQSAPVQADDARPNSVAPVYVLDARYKTDQVTLLFSRLKKAKLNFRTFDPNEQPRLSALEAIKQVRQSYGVLLTLLAEDQDLSDAFLHNQRCSFLAGLADGFNKVRYILQFGPGPVPIDYRDLVRPCLHPKDISDAVADFATEVVDALQRAEPVVREPRTLLAKLDLGASAAENELRSLGHYYLETEPYLRALRAETRMIVGRKGTGKTAVFFQVRDRIRANRANVVLDLKPDGYQLIKFKQSILRLLEAGTYEHTITAFWEYLLLLELCHKLLYNDRVSHTRDSRLYKPYRELEETYSSDDYVAEGDFAERMALLMRHIEDNYKARYSSPQQALTTPQITELLYMHDVAHLRDALSKYLRLKKEVWILVDNLDKGWDPHGIKEEDVKILRCLDDAARKLSRELDRIRITTRVLIFLRQDVYDLLVKATSDRGKEAAVSLDWTNASLLRELVRRRLVFSGRGALPDGATFLSLWRGLCVSYVNGEESSQFLIDRCLMRPRYLINLIEYCRGYAVNLRHDRIELEDIERALGAYSDDLVRDIGLEIRDISANLEDVLYAFVDLDPVLTERDLEQAMLNGGLPQDAVAKAKELLLWYGVLGILRANDSAVYIFDLNYNLKVLQGLMRSESAWRFTINPAFHSGLAVRSS